MDSEFLAELRQWAGRSEEDLLAFQTTLASAQRASQMESFLRRNPGWLAAHLHGGHGKWVIHRKNIPLAFQPAFIIGSKCSVGHDWEIVELCSPQHATRKAVLEEQLNKAVERIQSTRAMLLNNVEYLTNRVEDGGLALSPQDYALPALILGFREDDYGTFQLNGLRKQLRREQDIEIHSYDWIIRSFKDRSVEWEPPGSRLDVLEDELRECPSGQRHWSRFQNTIMNILQDVFSEQMSLTGSEITLEAGYKRTDVCFRNRATHGFFFELSLHHKLRCGTVIVECKNTKKRLTNEDFDQLNGRLGKKTGQVGFLVAREFPNRDDTMQRASAYFSNHEKLIIPLEDSDVLELLRARRYAQLDKVDRILDGIADSVRHML